MSAHRCTAHTAHRWPPAQSVAQHPNNCAHQLSRGFIECCLNAAAVCAHPEAITYAGAVTKPHRALDGAVRLPRSWLLHAMHTRHDQCKAWVLQSCCIHATLFRNLPPGMNPAHLVEQAQVHALGGGCVTSGPPALGQQLVAALLPRQVFLKGVAVRVGRQAAQQRVARWEEAAGAGCNAIRKHLPHRGRAMDTAGWCM